MSISSATKAGRLCVSLIWSIQGKSVVLVILTTMHLAVRIVGVGGWWGRTFWFFKSLDINMVYTLDVYVYI